MLFSDVIETAKRKAFPEGMPRNLQALIGDVVIDCVIDLQRHVPRMISSQFTVTRSTRAIYQAGVTIVERPAPQAKIKRVYTYTSPDHRDALYYTPVPRSSIETAQAVPARVTGSGALPSVDINDGNVSSVSGRGQVMHTADLDKGYRANGGVFAVVGGKLWLYPAIESIEKISVEWTGVKYDFQPADLVDWDRSVVRALELWMRKEHALFNTADASAWQVFDKEYASIRRSMASEDNDAAHADADQPIVTTPSRIILTDAETGVSPDDDMTASSIYASVDAVRAATVPDQVLMVHIEFINGVDAGTWYKRRPTSNDADDGVNYVHDSTGAVFQRIG